MSTMTRDERIARTMAKWGRERALLAVPACPTWCSLPEGHPWDDGPSHGEPGALVFVREHRGPRLGPFVACGWEQSDAPGQIRREIMVNFGALGTDADLDVETAADMRRIASQAVAAAEWMESRPTAV